MTAVAIRKTTNPNWQPGSLQVLLVSQPKTMPMPTSPPSLILEPPEGADQEDAPLPLPMASLFPPHQEVNRVDPLAVAV